MGLTECRIIHKVYNLLSPSLHWLDLRFVSSTHLVQDDLIHSLVQIWYMYLRWYWGWGNLCTETRGKWIDTRYRSSRSFHGFQLTIDWCMVTATSRLWNVLVCDVEVCVQVPGSAISNHPHEGQQLNLPARCPPYQHTQLGSVRAGTYIILGSI